VDAGSSRPTPDGRAAAPTGRALLRQLAGASAAGAVLAAAAGALPLLEVPGFELGLAASLACALVAGPLAGIAAARRELARAGPRAPSAARAFGEASAVVTVALVAAFAASAARAALVTPCRPLASAPLFGVVALPSALLAAALGVGAGIVARGRRVRAAFLYAAVTCASLTVTLLVAYLGPAASVADHLLGVWPGPLYDEALAVDARLALFRAGTLAWTAAAVAAVALVARRRAGARLLGPTACLALAVAAALAARAAGGGPTTRAALAEALGGVREGPRCVVHFPREKSASDAERILRDCEYNADAVARALALARPPRVTVWLYRSADEKRRLVGAGRTSYTKPWLAEVHVHDEGVPHPLLRHELVHALASAEARGPLRLPARAGVIVNGGLVEGLAMAVDVPAGNFGLHAWTRAMRDQGRLPALASLLGAGGFLGTAQARAYVAAGSFLRYQLDRHGPAAVLAAYREDDVARAFGRPLAVLEAEWQRFLDGVPVPAALAAAAEARFAHGSLFARACAREVADLDRRASLESASGRAAAAEALLRRAGALSGGDPAWLRVAADAWRAAGDLGRAQAILEEALRAAERAGGRPALRSGLLASLGDVRMRRGDAAGASERYREALALGVLGAEARTIQAKLAAADDPRLREAVAPWLLGVGDPALALARLAESDAPLARYLLSRARLARGAPVAARSSLASLDVAALPGPAFETEARRMAADALCRSGHWAEGIAAWTAIAADAQDAPREQAEDAARRCAFERVEYGAPVIGDADWPDR
jgi:hypothetical protein